MVRVVNRTPFAVIAVAALVLGVVAVILAATNSDDSGGATSTTVTAVAASPTQLASSDAAGLSINEVYRRAGPGVVDIKVTGGEGAGVVYDRDGNILTDEHVVGKAKSATVTFADGNTANASVVGTDPSTDVGVIHVGTSSSDLHPIPFGNSTSAEVGDPVVAIGSPFGLPRTVTSGIVSAVGRDIPAPNGYTIVGAIQTDAPINPGNSGGPLLNGRARVLGLADQIETGGTLPGQQGQSSGVGFATPSNVVARVANHIIAGQPVPHAYMGVSLNSSSTASGAQVANVNPGSPAAKAGLQSGDVITAINGKRVTSTQQLIEQVDASAPGQTVTLTVKRGGTTQTVKLKLANRPKTVAGG
jgi:putative serine protease PepD